MWYPDTLRPLGAGESHWRRGAVSHTGGQPLLLAAVRFLHSGHRRCV